MEQPIEIKLQKTVEDWLSEKGLWAFSVFYTGATKKLPALLKVSFFIPQEVDEFLGYLQYSVLADKSGIEVYRETRTILLSGLGLRLFFKVLECE